ncbi:MAG: hypothetical protein EKK61_05830 [Rickettsiales bacterium]|nr:MAG: hypothetical protein EKK61_05830 [Rickettsiales bacterium]
MKKKIIGALIFFVMCSNSFADEEIKLPELPSIEVENTLSDQEISFWQKVKNFFGFGNIESKELNKTEVISPTMDTSRDLDQNTLSFEMNLENDSSKTQEFTQNLPLNDPKNMANKENMQPDNNISLPPQDDKSSENKIASPDDKKNVINDLKLPEGFDDEVDVKKNVKEPESSKDLNVGNADNKEASTITKTEEIDQLHVPTLDEIDNKEGQTSKVSSNSASINEPKKEIASDAVQVPTLDAADNKANKTSEIISNTSSIDSKIVSDQNNQPKSAVPNITSTIETKNSVPSNPDVVTNQNKDSTGSLVPTYASETESKDYDSKLLQYKTDLKSNKDKLKNITQISAKELVKNKKPLENDPEQIEFIKNEAQVLTLPDDEIVLGSVTKDAQYELMDIRTYIDVFWNEYYKLVRESKAQELKKYIKNYNENFNENY